MSPEFYCLECIVAMSYESTMFQTPPFDIDAWAKALANEENS